MLRPEPSRDKELFDSINDVVVYHSRLIAAKEYADQIVRLGPFEHEAPCVEICGPSGVGKTTLWEWIEREKPKKAGRVTVKLPRRPDMTAKRRPYLTIKLAENPTLDDVCATFLTALGDKEATIGNIADKTRRVDLFLHHCQVRAVFIDEAQYVVDKAGIHVAERIVDWLRDRHSSASRRVLGLPEPKSVAFCLLGLGRLDEIFSGDPQRIRRWDAGWRMEPYGREPDDMADFAGVLGAFLEASALPLAPGVDPDDPLLQMRFHYATWGIPGGIKKLLAQAMMLAALPSRPYETLDLALLARAFVRQVRTGEHAVTLPRKDETQPPVVEPMRNPFLHGFDPSWPTPALPDDRLPIPAARDRRAVRKRAAHVRARLAR